jgi:hypothetical protein
MGWTVRESNPGGGEIFRTSLACFTAGTGSFPGLNRPGRGVDHPPSSSTEVKKRVELCLYSPLGPSWPTLGWTLPWPYYSECPVDWRGSILRCVVDQILWLSCINTTFGTISSLLFRLLEDVVVSLNFCAITCVLLLFFFALCAACVLAIFCCMRSTNIFPFNYDDQSVLLSGEHIGACCASRV